MIEVVFIPPLSMLNVATHQRYQLVLPQLVQDPRYREYLDIQAAILDKHFILDNGAAENVKTDPKVLLQIADDWLVQELAVPDILGDQEGTIYELNKFFSENEEKIAEAYNDSMKLGFVAQGNDHREAMRTVNKIMEGPWAQYLDVVYLPRLLVDKGDTYARVALAHNIAEAYPGRLQMHAFGASMKWVREVYALCEETTIRSIDTSLPISLAIAGKSLRTTKHAVGIPSRIKDYFQYSNKSVAEYELVRENCKEYLALAEGVEL